VFHAWHQGALSDRDQVAQLGALAVPIVVAVLLLAVQWRRAEVVA
jgi:hypothetical protein